MNALATAMCRPGAAWLWALALAALSASPAAAQGNPGLLGVTPSVIEPGIIIQNNYQQTTTTTSVNPPIEGPCTDVVGCIFVFNRVQVGKQLIVTQMSCSGNATQSVLWATVLVQRPNGSAPLRRQTVTGSINASSLFAVSGSTLQLFNAKDRPLVAIQMDTGGDVTSAQCTIAGQLFDAPP